MKITYWFKLGALTLALTLTVISIYWLNQGHMTKFWSSLGLGNNQQMLNWCENRVQSLTFPQPMKASITEEAGKWLWKSDTDVLLNYLSMEKWLARYCQLPIKKVPFKDFNAPMSPLLEVKFISGETATFYDLGEGRFQLQDHIFSSPDLDKAMKELLAFGPNLE